MTERPSDLPEFDRPPVVEVAIGVQFEPIRQFRQAHIGLVWNEMRSEYPMVQDQPRLETAIETVDAGQAGPSLHLEFTDAPPVRRAWFISADESLLVQVQDDRIIHNWRHRGGEYPRFEPLLDLFWSQYDSYLKALSDAALMMTPIQQAEVTYINWVPAESMDQFFGPSMVAELSLLGVGPRPDTQQWSARYPVIQNDIVVGRLSIETQPGRRVERGKVTAGFQLALTFRAPVPADAARAGVSALLLAGRDVIVRSFTAVTTSEMHEQWGRRN